MPGKELVTESCVRQMTAGTELLLGPNRIATPAALDLAFQRGIRVRRGEDPAGEHGDCGCDKTCLWSRIKAEEGTYVVTVSGGHATVVRVDSEGPRTFGQE